MSVETSQALSLLQITVSARYWANGTYVIGFGAYDPERPVAKPAECENRIEDTFHLLDYYDW